MRTRGALTFRLGDFFSGNHLVMSAWPTPDLGALGYHLMGHPPFMVRLPGGHRPVPPPELTITAVTQTKVFNNNSLSFGSN